MAIKKYFFDYMNGEASAEFLVDTDKFTNELATATLTFFMWDYDKEANPVDEVMKKYAAKVIGLASNCSHFGVIQEFKSMEGYCSIDGSSGIKLINVSEIGFDNESLEMEVSNA